MPFGVLGIGLKRGGSCDTWLDEGSEGRFEVTVTLYLPAGTLPAVRCHCCFTWPNGSVGRLDVTVTLYLPAGTLPAVRCHCCFTWPNGSLTWLDVGRGQNTTQSGHGIFQSGVLFWGCGTCGEGGVAYFGRYLPHDGPWRGAVAGGGHMTSSCQQKCATYDDIALLGPGQIRHGIRSRL